MDIRSAIKGFDPLFYGTTQIEDPETGQKIMVPVMAVDNFSTHGRTRRCISIHC